MHDCAKCLEAVPAAERQLWGCGWEPALDTVSLAWEPPRGETTGYAGDPLTTCPNYTAQLPEVFETKRARVHWSKGQLETFCADEPAEMQLMAIEVLEGSFAEYELWRVTPAVKGGGADGGE